MTCIVTQLYDLQVLCRTIGRFATAFRLHFGSFLVSAAAALSLTPLAGNAASFSSVPVRCATLTHPTNGEMTIQESTYAMFAQQHPEPEIDTYLSEVCKLETLQALNPGAMFRYTDQANGALVKAALNPARAAAVIARAQTAIAQYSEPNRLLSAMGVLEPLLTAYVGAFEVEPAAFEGEYLDSLEITSALLRANLAGIDLAFNQAATHASNGQNQENASAVRKSVRNVMTSGMEFYSHLIRQQIKAGKFSSAGRKRADRIAQSFTLPE